MKIEQVTIPIREIVKDYEDNQENGVFGYGGKLNIRPPFQREFIYKGKDREAVIETISRGFPLNSIYWIKNGDGNYELLDGQQRILSFCQYINGDFSINSNYFFNLTKEERENILDYQLSVYICEGTDREKLDWFKVINTQGKTLNDQELRNAIYAGPWTEMAKRYFSKIGCPAYGIASDYISGSVDRQDFFQKALKWIVDFKGLKSVEDYMSLHQFDKDSQELWLYFNNVIDWVVYLFPHTRKEMKNVDWGPLYNKHKDKSFNPEELEEQVKELILDDDVTSKKGIYPYLITGDEKHLNIRKFTQKQKIEAYEKQEGFCKICGNHFDLNEMEADHITPWSQGGKTVTENLQMLCRNCNRRKSDT